MIEIYTDGRTFGQRGSGITVILRHDQYEWRRGFLLGKLTTNQLELKAIEYALKSIVDASKDEKITIYSLNRYAVMMLEKVDGKWTKGVEKNTELIEEIRKQYDRFTNISIVYDPTHTRFQDVKKRTEEMVKNKQEFFEKV